MHKTEICQVDDLENFEWRYLKSIGSRGKKFKYIVAIGSVRRHGWGQGVTLKFLITMSKNDWTKKEIHILL
jgi:hypothetical protein